MLQQSKASRRPFFSIDEPARMDKGGTDRAEIRNVGSGIAYNVVWKIMGFQRHDKSEIGAVPPNVGFRVVFPNGSPLTYHT